VKQRPDGGTFLHNDPGINGFFGGKTPFPGPCFCERNENRKIKLFPGGDSREQRHGCPVFIGKTVIK
jgi:hypothetical protein